jgi:P pilus assembly chaperone PapD
MDFQGKISEQAHLHHTAVVLFFSVVFVAAWDYVKAASTTAYAEVTVRIVPPLTPVDALTVYPSSIDLNQEKSAELAITNQASVAREIHVDLVMHSGNASDCNIHYSPATFTIQPSSTQVVRILKTMGAGQSCRIDQALIISDAKKLDRSLFEVPLGSSDN